MNEQKLVNHKLEETQIRMQQHKYSEYDWKNTKSSLKNISLGILNPLK